MYILRTQTESFRFSFIRLHIHIYIYFIYIAIISHTHIYGKEIWGSCIMPAFLPAVGHLAYGPLALFGGIVKGTYRVYSRYVRIAESSVMLLSFLHSVQPHALYPPPTSRHAGERRPFRKRALCNHHVAGRHRRDSTFRSQV